MDLAPSTLGTQLGIWEWSAWRSLRRLVFEVFGCYLAAVVTWDIRRVLRTTIGFAPPALILTGGSVALLGTSGVTGERYAARRTRCWAARTVEAISAEPPAS